MTNVAPNRDNQHRSFLTTTDLATICEVDPKTIHNWADNGKLKHFRTPGRHLRFERGHVVEFLKHFGYPVPKDLQDAAKGGGEK